MEGISTKMKILKIFLLMIVPWTFIVFLAPLYNTKYPFLGGWPFLYWYLFLWVFIQPVFTFIVFKYIDKERW
ncbi:MAG: DUF3311 domain-containing protein [Thermoplasmata archaeon]|nr:DUF3311 domain-containing protein [Euryarchaeota archaeon]MVT15273.1 DUF3311 domain-containing protein [Euryarchaeota archaeon]MVT36000.1 DUF3311 domain-containing protein [Euryarchaeota archaeon]